MKTREKKPLHKHKWVYQGESLDKATKGLDTFTCKCGAIMYEGYLEPEGD